MNDIRRTILWVIFGFSMVLLWDQWQGFNGHSATLFPSGKKPAVTAQAPASSGVPTSASSAPGASTSPATGAVPANSGAAPTPASERITVTTDLMRLTFDTEGGSLIRSELLKEPSDERDGPFVLL